MSALFDGVAAQAPRMPHETCPYIDDAMGVIDKNVKIIEEAVGKIDALTGRGPLEDLRTMNAGLRECAEYWMEMAKGFAEKIEDQREHIEDLESRVEAALRSTS